MRRRRRRTRRIWYWWWSHPLPRLYSNLIFSRNRPEYLMECSKLRARPVLRNVSPVFRIVYRVSIILQYFSLHQMKSGTERLVGHVHLHEVHVEFRSGRCIPSYMVRDQVRRCWPSGWLQRDTGSDSCGHLRIIFTNPTEPLVWWIRGFIATRRDV